MGGVADAGQLQECPQESFLFSLNFFIFIAIFLIFLSVLMKTLENDFAEFSGSRCCPFSARPKRKLKGRRNYNKKKYNENPTKTSRSKKSCCDSARVRDFPLPRDLRTERAVLRFLFISLFCFVLSHHKTLKRAGIGAQ